MSWEKVKLIDCCVSIADGDHQPPPKSETGIPFVTIANIVNNQFDFTNSMFVPNYYYEKLDSKRKAQKGDILYSVVGSFGIPVFIKDNKPFVFQRHIAILRPNGNIDARFLYYTMLSRDFYMKADAAAIGAAQRTVSLTALRNIEITVPPIETQRRIADIVSAYDDLIENNRKQIKLLEEAAQRLYKEWFVDLRFPGHEHTKIMDGVPEGWERAHLSDIADINANNIPKNYCFNYIEYTDLSAVQNGIIREKTRYALNEAPGRAKRMANDGDIIWGMVRPNLKSFALVLHPTETDVFSTGFCVLSAKKVPFTYLYYAVTTESFIKYLVNCTNGAAYPAVKPIHFSEAEIILPHEKILKRFNIVVEPMLRKREKLLLIINQASQARDRLLPKLMSGEVEV